MSDTLTPTRHGENAGSAHRRPDSLAGCGGVGALIRSRDGSRSKLGSPETWPAPLTTLVSLMLASNQPMFVVWGPERTLLYNDAYASILADKHPGALGRDFHEVWSEIGADLEPIVSRAYAGEPTHMDDIALVMQRRGYPEETHFSFSYTPVRDEAGVVAGFFCQCVETTEQVRAGKRLDVLLRLDDRLRDVADTAELSFAASELLGVSLGAVRVGYGVLDPEAGTILVERNWSAPGFGSVAGLHHFRDYGSYIEDLRRGEPASVVDVELDTRTAGTLEGFRTLGIRAFVDVPVVEQGRTTAMLFVHSATPRAWSAEEIAFVRDFAERTHAVIARRKAEQALRASEEFNRRVLASSTDCIKVLGLDGRLEFMSEGGLHMMEVDEPTSILGAYWPDFWTGEDRDGALAALGAAQAGGAGRLRGFVPTTKGAPRWWDVVVTPMAGPEGRPEKLLAISRDVTATKLADERLRELNATLAAQVAERTAERDRIWQLSPDLLLVAKLDGVMLSANPAWERILGWSPEWLAGRNAAEIKHPDDAARTAAELGRLAAGGYRTASFEDRYRHRDGSWRWLSWTIEPEGDLIYCIGRDVTADKAAREALTAAEAARREADALYRAYFENTAEALFVVGVLEDGGFTIEDLNPAHQASIGLPLAEVQGKRIDEVLPPELAEPVVHHYRAAIASNAVYQYRETFELHGRTTHWDTVLVPVRDADGRIVRLIGSSRDLTPQMAAEEQLRQSQKMEAMGQLTGGVAHDFNNLLTPIVGSLDMLQRRGLGNEREQRLISGAMQSAERAKTLVQRLLAFARRQPLQPVAVDLAALVNGMAGLIESTVGPKIDVRVELASDLPPAQADPNQLEMAILNLGVNARDAMPDGGALTIAAARESVRAVHPAKLRPGHYVRLSVSDTGEGMDEATLARAVEPFFSTKGVGKGTGLGLSMVHGLTAQLGGGLTIASSPGEGTSIDLWLPLGHGPIASDEARIDRPTHRQLGQALLVDDEELVRMSTADMLSDLGYEVVEASSAEEALRLLAGGAKPNLVVTDHLMPGMSGAELARQLKAASPGLPILIVSGYAEVDGIAPGLPRLTKPFRNAELAERVAELNSASAPQAG